MWKSEHMGYYVVSLDCLERQGGGSAEPRGRQGYAGRDGRQPAS